MGDNTKFDETEGSLGWVDWIAIGAVLGLSAAIGVYYRFTGGKQKTAEEYFAADRSTSITMLAIASMVSLLSGISILGCSGENYSYGALFNVIYLGLFFSTPLVAYLYLPVFYELKTMSIFEYLELRFGTSARLLASIAYFVQYSLFGGVVIYAPSLALEATTGLNGTMSILLIGLICTFYSTIGGIKAVIITDVIQGVLMFLCVYCVIGVASSELDDGLFGVLNTAAEGGRLNFNHWEFDPTIRHTWITLLIGGTFWFLSLYAASQVQIQRLLTAKTLTDARKSLLLNIPMTMALTQTVSFSGLVLYAYYKDCDPVKAGKIVSYDMIMPWFAKERMTRFPGLTGVFISGIFSASLSTVSAILNSLAAMALSDYIKPIYRKRNIEMDDSKAVLYGKILAFSIGLLSLGVAFLASKMGSLIQAVVSIHGALGGPVLGLFTLGMFFESANETGAVIGTGLALISSMIMCFTPKPKTPFLPMSIEECSNATLIISPEFPVDDPSSYFFMDRLSYLWYPPLGWNMAVTFGSIASFIVAKCSKISPPIVEPNLFTPIIAARIRRRREKEAANGSQVFVLDNKSFNQETL